MMNQRIAGVDVGTMYLCTAVRSDGNQVEINSMRNMFLPISTDVLETNELTNTELDYVIQKDDDGDDEKIFIIGEDAFRFSQIFGTEVRRPMSKGVISTGEIDAIDVLTVMLEKLIGRTEGGFVVYSVPAQSVDLETPPVLYHERVFGRIFSTLGYQSKHINEALAIVFSECKNSSYTGITISFGAGLTNVCCAYKGQPTLTFAISRGGDWIDSNVSSSLGVVQSRVTLIKEKDLDLLNPARGKKKESRIREALAFYYDELIRYVLNVFIKKFEESSDGLNIDTEIPIVVSGGTSKAMNFVELFRKIFNNTKNFPYDISEIRQAVDPLTAVAKGCLLYAIWDQQKKKE